jgi:hypothetical protein
VTVSLLFYVALFDRAGFFLSNFLLMEFLFIFGNPGKWILGTLGAFLCSSVSCVIFKTCLDIELPSGIREALLGIH